MSRGDKSLALGKWEILEHLPGAGKANLAFQSPIWVSEDQTHAACRSTTPRPGKCSSLPSHALLCSRRTAVRLTVAWLIHAQLTIQMDHEAGYDASFTARPLQLIHLKTWRDQVANAKAKLRGWGNWAICQPFKLAHFPYFPFLSLSLLHFRNFVLRPPTLCLFNSHCIMLFFCPCRPGTLSHRERGFESA